MDDLLDKLTEWRRKAESEADHRPPAPDQRRLYCEGQAQAYRAVISYLSDEAADMGAADGLGADPKGKSTWVCRCGYLNLPEASVCGACRESPVR